MEFAEVVRDVKASDFVMSDAQYEFLFDHYCNNGEMPYGVAKARTGDPYEWILEQLERE